MKRLIIGCSCLLICITSCEPDHNTNPEASHFKMTVNGTELSTDPTNVIYFYDSSDTAFGIYAAGGTVIYNAIELYHCNQPGTYTLQGDFHASTGGLRYQTVDSIYYIDSYHGSGTVKIDSLVVEPGAVHRVKGSFSGTAETDHGHTVTITNGDYYYHDH